jgi:hypothetical protein
VTNPYEPPGSFEADRARTDRIASYTNKSIIYGVLGLVCCGLIFGPLALNAASQAEAAIILDDSGASHGSGYKIGRALGYAAIGLWALGLVLRIAGALMR